MSNQNEIILTDEARTKIHNVVTSTRQPLMICGALVGSAMVVISQPLLGVPGTEFNFLAGSILLAIAVFVWTLGKGRSDMELGKVLAIIAEDLKKPPTA